MANLIAGFLNIIKGNEIRNPSDKEDAKSSEINEPNRIFACINEISKILRNGLSIDTTLTGIIEVIPQAFRSS